MGLGTATVFIIGQVFPEPETTAAGQRMLQIINFFISEGYEVVLGSCAAPSIYSAELEKWGVETTMLRLNSDTFNEHLKWWQPKIVLFDRFMTEEQFSWRVKETLPNAIRILNQEDLHSLRIYREICFNNNSKFSISTYYQQDTTQRELASVFRSDLVLCISPEEMEMQRQMGVPSDLLQYWPFVNNVIITQKSYPNWANRKHFIFYGNGKHAPNINAILYLKQKIWPEIKKQLPQAELHIYGAYLPQKIRDLHNAKEGFIINGWIEDLDTILSQYRVLLAPLHFGAGLKGKLYAAFQNGLPSVTTTLGFEGYPTTNNLPLIIQDGFNEQIQAAVSLYTQEILWTQIHQNAISYGAQLFDSERIKTDFKNKLSILMNSLNKKRSNNFIGLMLWHQTLTASKYMGKWITLKNQKQN